PLPDAFAAFGREPLLLLARDLVGARLRLPLAELRLLALLPPDPPREAGRSLVWAMTPSLRENFLFAAEFPPSGEVEPSASDLARRASVRQPAILRRSRISNRCLRWVATAARFSSVSIASLRLSGLRERSAGPS